MKPLPDLVADEVRARCVADHNVDYRNDPDDPEDCYTIVDSARIVKVRPGHAAFGADGICPTCGRLSGYSPQYDALPQRERWHAATCFERADWVAELRYHVVEENCTGHSNKSDVEYGAIYGVTVQGDDLHIAVWMD